MNATDFIISLFTLVAIALGFLLYIEIKKEQEKELDEHDPDYDIKEF